jgi:hypothetical protein
MMWSDERVSELLSLCDSVREVPNQDNPLTHFVYFISGARDMSLVRDWFFDNTPAYAKVEIYEERA